MALDQLRVLGFRNLEDGALPPFGRINTIVGANGSGKTSLLEAIHVLARARSFRAARLDAVATHGQELFRLVADLTSRGTRHRVGLERGRRQFRVRVDGADVRVLSELARFLPVQVINTDSQRLLQDGPGLRRQFLNWTTFHVEPGFRECWRRYERALRQRNAAIRLHDRRLTGAWDQELIESGESVTEQRQIVIRDLARRLEPFLTAWLPGIDVEMAYRPGWRRGCNLREALLETGERQWQRGFTLAGPHRADLLFRANSVPAQQWLSRGQQKILVIALILAVTERLREDAAADPILLVDDLAAELDGDRRHQVVEALLATGAQVFMTATAVGELPAINEASWFHVEHGRLREMLQ